MKAISNVLVDVKNLVKRVLLDFSDTASRLAATMLTATVIVEDNKICDTAYATIDRKTLKPKIGINASFWKLFPVKIRFYLLMHELMHIKLGHIFGDRFKDKNLVLVNIATDTVINQYLPYFRDEGFEFSILRKETGRVEKVGCWNFYSFCEKIGKSELEVKQFAKAEYYLELLEEKQEQDKQESSNDSGQSEKSEKPESEQDSSPDSSEGSDSDDPGQDTPGQGKGSENDSDRVCEGIETEDLNGQPIWTENHENHVAGDLPVSDDTAQNIIDTWFKNEAERFEAGNAIGNCPLLDLFKKKREKTIDWMKVIKRFIATAKAQTYEKTRKRKNKRYGWKVAGKRREKKADITVLLDVSGSMCHNLPSVMSELYNLASMQSIDFEFYAVDVQLFHVGKVKDAAGFNKLVNQDGFFGGGGTDFTQALTDLAKAGSKAVIFITDTYARWPVNNPLPQLLIIATDKKSPSMPEWALTRSIDIDQLVKQNARVA